MGLTANLPHWDVISSGFYGVSDFLPHFFFYFFHLIHSIGVRMVTGAHETNCAFIGACVVVEALLRTT